ncbi:hypothetical protein Tco_0888460 [Tanacetum coccineum]
MAANQAIEYAPHYGDLTMESLTFHNNNVVVMNGKKPLILDYKIFVESIGLDYAKGTCVSSLPLGCSRNKKKVKSQIVTPTLPKSQGPEASGALLKKRQKPKSKKTPTKTQVTPSTRPTEVMSTWMAFAGNTRDLGSFGDETDKTTTLHRLSQRIMHIERGDGVAITKRRHQDFQSDGVRDLAMALGRSQLKGIVKLLVKSLRDPHQEGSEQSHLVSSGNVPDPQDPERNIQLAGMGLPSIQLDGGTRKSQPLPESTTIDPKELGGNV